MQINKMKKGIVATIVSTTIAMVGVSVLTILGHYVPRHIEQEKISSIPKVVQQIKQTRERVRDYFSDGFITPAEAEDLYRICRSGSDSGMLRDIHYRTTDEGAKIISGLFGMRKDFFPVTNKLQVSDLNGRKYDIEVMGRDVSNSDALGRIDKLLEDFESYLQTTEYRDLVRPLNPKERLKAYFTGFVKD